MLKVTNKEILESTHLDDCWFFPVRVSDKKDQAELIRLFCADIITGMELDDCCVFFIKARDYVKILKSEPWGWELEVLSPEASKPYMALEWATKFL